MVFNGFEGRDIRQSTPCQLGPEANGSDMDELVDAKFVHEKIEENQHGSTNQ
jgi:hypothetical protein